MYPPTVTRSHSHRKESTPSTHGHHLVFLTRHHAYRVDNSECDQRSQQRYPLRVKSQRPPEALISGPRTPCRARGADMKLSCLLVTGFNTLCALEGATVSVRDVPRMNKDRDGVPAKIVGTYPISNVTDLSRNPSTRSTCLNEGIRSPEVQMNFKEIVGLRLLCRTIGVRARAKTSSRVKGIPGFRLLSISAHRGVH